MKRIKLNTQKSIESYESGNFFPRQCYDNVFENVGSMGFKYKEEDLKIMFCYMSIEYLENVYTRHVCYYIDGMAIDPTIVSVYKDKVWEKDVEYIPIKIMTVDEYFILLSREGRTDLVDTLLVVEKIVQKELIKDEIMVIG